MKGFLSAVGTIALIAILVSCAGFPEPESQGNTLVIGSLILAFPDGFFDTPAQRFEVNVKLSFRNTTKNTKFDLFTSRGYFYFQTNGTDEYLLEDFGLQDVTIGDTKYSFGGSRIDMKIDTTPNRVIYLGHIVFTYTAAAETKRSGRTTYYKYDSAVSVDWDKGKLVQYIKDRQADSPWLGMEIVEYGKKQ
jgi:hypothetical protein